MSESEGTGEELSIDITPSPEGFTMIIQQFRECVIGDAKESRREAVRELLKGIEDVAIYLYRVGIYKDDYREDIYGRTDRALELHEIEN